MTGRTQLMENRSERPKFENSENVVGVCFAPDSGRRDGRILRGRCRPKAILRINSTSVE